MVMVWYGVLVCVVVYWCGVVVFGLVCNGSVFEMACGIVGCWRVWGCIGLVFLYCVVVVCCCCGVLRCSGGRVWLIVV